MFSLSLQNTAEANGNLARREAARRSAAEPLCPLLVSGSVDYLPILIDIGFCLGLEYKLIRSA